MIQKLTRVVPVDKCGVWLIKIIHPYTKLSKIAKISSFTKNSIQLTKPDNWLKKGKKTKNLFVISSSPLTKNYGVSYQANYNKCMLLKKRLTPRGSKVIGPIDNLIRRKRARASFIKVI